MMRRTQGLLLGLLIFLHSGYALGQASLSEIISRVGSQTVSVQAIELPRFSPPQLDPQIWFFGEPLPPGKSRYPLASGFVLPDGRHVATSFRQLAGQTELMVITADGASLPAQLLGADPAADLAVLKLKSKKLPGLDLGQSSGVGLGDNLLYFGRSLPFLMQRAQLAAREGAGGSRHWLIDRPTHPGVAGGPVVDTRGRVLGMVIFDPRGPSELGRVLPSAQIQQLSAQLLKSGRISRAWLGVLPKNLVALDTLDSVRDVAIKGGVQIENLIVDGPAAKAGLQIGDLILKFGSQALLDVRDLQSALDKSRPGTSIAVELYRSGKGRMSLSLTLGDQPSAQDLPSAASLL